MTDQDIIDQYMFRWTCSINWTDTSNIIGQGNIQEMGAIISFNFIIHRQSGLFSNEDVLFFFFLFKFDDRFNIDMFSFSIYVLVY
jgi:hypothetical protein